MSVLPSAPPPSGPLGRYRMLAPSASVRVSPLCLGGMNFGDAWKDYMGACDQKTTENILDVFYENGFGESETWIGEWMQKRGNRDEMVIATKFTTNFRAGQGGNPIMANSTGNGSKSLHTSLMQSLNSLVTNGKVLYLGISDTPAWVVTKANQYARDHGLRQFSVYQGRWSAADRDFEREIIPMVRDEGMALAPWGALGGGAFKTEEQRKAQDGRKIQADEKQIKVSQALEAVANRKTTKITSVALAYVMHKAPYVFPIVGGRTADHLKSNIEALKLELDEKDIEEIDGAVPFDLGFPNSFLWRPKIPAHPGQVWLLAMGGTFDYVPIAKSITPAKDA
ncbi:norsolorinic acid reductase [Podospora appendiculata]|uniref:Norsolorinic acid reductase n=1 Tax=Podospora appendiculata TaxID=314037 RepID=A0AAE0X984_9PEZI|nr:norsolorinic acid reductase [Podospora appendiculata]